MATRHFSEPGWPGRGRARRGGHRAGGRRRAASLSWPPRWWPAGPSWCCGPRTWSWTGRRSWLSQTPPSQTLPSTTPTRRATRGQGGRARSGEGSAPGQVEGCRPPGARVAGPTSRAGARPSALLTCDHGAPCRPPAGTPRRPPPPRCRRARGPLPAAVGMVAARASSASPSSTACWPTGPRRQPASPGAGCSASAGSRPGMALDVVPDRARLRRRRRRLRRLPRRWPAPSPPAGRWRRLGLPAAITRRRGAPLVLPVRRRAARQRSPSARRPARSLPSPASAASCCSRGSRAGPRHGAVGPRPSGRGARPRVPSAAVARASSCWPPPSPRGATTSARARITFVQGGGPQGTHAVDTDPRVVFERHLDATRTLEPGPIDLVVWPENVIDVHDVLDQRRARRGGRRGRPARRRRSWSASPRTPGPSTSATPRSWCCPTARSATATTRCAGVPFGEYMPLRGLLEPASAQPTDLVPPRRHGRHGPAVLDSADRAASAVVISWEVFFGGRARDGVRSTAASVAAQPHERVELHAAPILQTQQIASSRLRALETGRWVVQVAPDRLQRLRDARAATVLDRTGISEQAVRTRTVDAARRRRRWYVRLGRQADRGRRRCAVAGLAVRPRPPGRDRAAADGSAPRAAW